MIRGTTHRDSIRLTPYTIHFMITGIHGTVTLPCTTRHLTTTMRMGMVTDMAITVMGMAFHATGMDTTADMPDLASMVTSATILHTTIPRGATTTGAVPTDHAVAQRAAVASWQPILGAPGLQQQPAVAAPVERLAVQ